jgi:hypothetical protein
VRNDLHLIRAEDIGASAPSIPGAAPPLAASGKLLAGKSEADNDAAGIPEVIPIHLAHRRGHARKQVVHLGEPDSEVASRIPVNSDSGRRRKRIAIDCLLAVSGIGMDKSKQDLTEW